MSRTRRSWLPKWLANPRTGRARSARLRVEEMERRITPATFYVTPPLLNAPPNDASDLRTDVASANANADPSNTIYMMGGDYTLTAGELDITKNLTIQRDPMDTSGGAQITIEGDSSGNPGVFAISSGVTLTASDSDVMEFNGSVTGSGAVTWDGTGTLILSMTVTGADTYSGGTTVDNGGNMTIDSGASLGTGTVTGSGYAAFSTILWNGDNTATNVFYLDGMTLAVVTSYTLTLDRAAIGGGYLGNSLVGDTGIFSTDATDGAHIADTTSFATVESNCELDHFQDFTNADGGEIDVAAGVNTSGTGSTENFDAFTNDPGGTVFIGATSVVNVDSFENDAGASVTMDDRSVMNASYFVSEGNLTLNPSASSGDYTLLTNLGGLYFGQGSMTQLGTPDTAGSPPNFLDGIDLNGHNVTVSGFHEYSPTLMEYVPGAVFNNDGFVVDWAGSATLTIDGNSTYHGAEYKGEGFSGVTVNTENNGYVLAGDCPGTLNFADLTVGAGGVDKEQFQIDNATGAAGELSGWSLLATGNFSWAATTDHKLTVNLQTLSNTTTVGNDVAGSMANFDPTQSYTWAAVKWTGSYTGPTDVADLNASTVFDTSGIANSFSGTFAWSLDLSNNTLNLTYTPS